MPKRKLKRRRPPPTSDSIEVWKSYIDVEIARDATPEPSLLFVELSNHRSVDACVPDRDNDERRPLEIRYRGYSRPSNDEIYEFSVLPGERDGVLRAMTSVGLFRPRVHRTLTLKRTRRIASWCLWRLSPHRVRGSQRTFEDCPSPTQLAALASRAFKVPLPAAHSIVRQLLAFRRMRSDYSLRHEVAALAQAIVSSGALCHPLTARRLP